MWHLCCNQQNWSDRGTGDLSCYGAVICKREGAATRREETTRHAALEPAEAVTGVRANLSLKVSGWEFLFLSENLTVWATSDSWPVTPRAAVTSDWAKHPVKKRWLAVVTLNHSEGWFLDPDCGTVGLNMCLLQERRTDVLLRLHLLGWVQLPLCSGT